MEFQKCSKRRRIYPKKIQLIRTILTVLLPFPYLLWGTRNRTCLFFCLPILPRNPLNVLGHIIRRWKDNFKENTTPLEL